MIIERTGARNGLGSDILPKGDRYDVPPGRRQFGLASLFWLLTIGALVAALCHWLNLGPEWLTICEIYVVFLWWSVAQLREEVPPKDPSDQSELREEVRRWLRDREQR